MRMVSHRPQVVRALAGWWVAAVLLTSQLGAQACMGDSRDNGIAARRWLPLTESAVQHVPAQQSMPIGSLYAYLVPAGTKASIKVIAQGSMAPLEVVPAETVERLRPRIRFEDRGGAPIQTPAGQQWLYVYASSYGKSELRLSGPFGWTYSVVLGMVYPQAQPVGEPQALDVSGSAGERRFVVDANHNTLWLSVPGRVDEGWRITSGEETSFELMRVEQLAVPYGDEPRVALFLVAGRSVRSGEIEIQSGRGLLGAKRSIRFKVDARPVPAC